MLVEINKAKLKTGDKKEWAKFHSDGAQADRAQEGLEKARKLLKQDPKHKLQQQSLQLDELSLRLSYAIKQILSRETQKQQTLQSKLAHFSPEQTVNIELQKQSQLKTRLQSAMHNKLKESENDF